MSDKQYKPTVPRGSRTLPELLRADCGHFVAATTRPVGRRGLPNGGYADVYLCAPCREALAQSVKVRKRIA